MEESLKIRELLKIDPFNSKSNFKVIKYGTISWARYIRMMLQITYNLRS